MRRSARIQHIVEVKVKTPKIKTPKSKPTKLRDEVHNINSSNLLNRIKKTGRNPDIEISPENKEKASEIELTLAELRAKMTEDSGGKEHIKQRRKPKKIDLNVNCIADQNIVDLHCVKSSPVEKTDLKQSACKEKDITQEGNETIKHVSSEDHYSSDDMSDNEAENYENEAEDDESEDEDDENEDEDDGNEDDDNHNVDKDDNDNNHTNVEEVDINEGKIHEDDIDDKSTVDFNINVEKVIPVPDVSTDEDSNSSNDEKRVDCIPAASVEKKVTSFTDDYKQNLLSNFYLDRTKYTNMNEENRLASNPLMKTLNYLKKSFPFKDHLLNNKDSTNYDVLCLDSLPLTTVVCKSDLTKLSSHVQATHQPKLYFDTSSSKTKKSNLDATVKKLMSKSVLEDDLEKKEKAPKLYVSKHLVKAESKKKSEETAGKGWFNLPKTEITDSIKKDLQLLKMRGALDPKKHYKRNDTNKFPKYFQMGTVVEGAHEFYSSRIPQGKRKKTMVDELLEDADFRRKNKKKYLEIRKKQMSGGKGFYKKLKNKKKATWERT